MKIIALPTQTVAAWRRGGLDAHGQVPQRISASSGSGAPCRHCLGQVPEGRPYLVLAHRPFSSLGPYTECGPIFVCADDCPRGGADLPSAMLAASGYIVRGYSADDRIVYGTGGVIETPRIAARCVELLDQAEIAYVHVRSASNNCYFFRVQR